jgi:hypothetical protein
MNAAVDVPRAVSDDEALEVEIETARRAMTGCYARKEMKDARVFAAIMKRLIEQRSAAQVARMARERGLAS